LRGLLVLAIVGFYPLYAEAQTARSAAPFDITGYWAAIVTEGNVDDPPLKPEGRRVAQAWKPAKDKANGEQCKAYGAGGVMRLPGRLHITWENDDTLRLETDAGMQTRRFFFGGSQPFPTQPSWQGHSVARWDRQLMVTTTHLRPGYLSKKGIPYSASTVMSESLTRLVDSGQVFLEVTIVVDDPVYLTQPYSKTYRFKKQSDASGWNPTPC
jgi:hypothetical protein